MTVFPFCLLAEPVAEGNISSGTFSIPRVPDFPDYEGPLQNFAMPLSCYIRSVKLQ